VIREGASEALHHMRRCAGPARWPVFDRGSRDIDGR